MSADGKAEVSVSILVLVEVAQEGFIWIHYQLQRYSFNPCSSGSGSGRLVEHTTAYLKPGFNPCSSGSGSGRISEKVTVGASPTSFNPCSSGSGSGSRLSLRHFFEMERFQSLFQWKWLRKEINIFRNTFLFAEFQSLFQWKWLRKNHSGTIGRYEIISFNPCSSGSGSGRSHLCEL